MRSTQLAMAVAAFASVSLAADAHFWRTQSIYQIMTDRFARTDGDVNAPCETSNNDYCGGTWKGIESQLDYIQNMGFTAVWISPITAQIEGMTKEGTGYHGYWPIDLYSLNSKFGTADDLKSLAKEIHGRNMSFMIDVIPNHMAWPGAHGTIDYTKFTPFNSQSFFHDFCELNKEIATAGPGNATNILRKCWLGDDIVSLPDLKTEDPAVASILNNWLKDTVSTYSIDGLRIDAAKHIDPGFFPPFLQAAGGIFGMGEVLDGDAGAACTWQKDSIGSVLNYPVYFPIRRAFGGTNGSMLEIVDALKAVKAGCSDPTVLGSFSESHDLDRFPTITDDLALAANLLTYSWMSDGIPIIYQGQEQHISGYQGDNTNRQALWTVGYKKTAPLYQHIAKLNLARQAVIKASYDWTTSLAQVAYVDKNVLALSKGPAEGRTLTVLNNNGVKGSAYTFTIPVTKENAWAPGTNLTDALSCTTITITSDGKLNVPITQGKAIVYLPTTQLAGSGLCSATTTGSSAAPSASKKGAASSVRVSFGKLGAVLAGVAIGFAVLL